MAVLWDQREMVAELQRLMEQSAENPPDFGENTREFIEALSYSGEGDHWTLENNLVESLVNKKALNGQRLKEVLKWKSVLNACIKDGFIDEKLNKKYQGLVPIDKSSKKTSKRMVQVTSHKGAELLNRTYYRYKYIPDTFTDPAKIVVSVLAAIITAALTTAGVLFFTSKQNNVGVYNDHHGRQSLQVSRPAP